MHIVFVSGFRFNHVIHVLISSDIAKKCSFFTQFFSTSPLLMVVPGVASSVLKTVVPPVT